jgi:hypothetical protein
MIRGVPCTSPNSLGFDSMSQPDNARGTPIVVVDPFVGHSTATATTTTLPLTVLVSWV